MNLIDALQTCKCARVYFARIANKVTVFVNLDCRGNASKSIKRVIVANNYFRQQIWMTSSEYDMCDVSLMHFILIQFDTGMKCLKRIKSTVYTHVTIQMWLENPLLERECKRHFCHAAA